MEPLVVVLLPPRAADAAVRAVVAGGGVPVLDLVSGAAPQVPDGAWVRIRPEAEAPGDGPVVLAGPGEPVAGRPTWLETPTPGPVPPGFVGLVLKGREAGGRHGEEDGLILLASCPEPDRVILDAGLGPRTAAAAAALGAAGAWLGEAHLACPEVALPDSLAARLGLPDDEVSTTVAGVRAAAGPTSPVVRALLDGAAPLDLAAGAWEGRQGAAWLAGQGLALARGLAEQHGGLEALVRAYRDAMRRWRDAAESARPAAGPLRPAATAAALAAEGTVAVASSTVGSGVLWEEAAWLGRPVGGGPLRAALAVGVPVHGSPSDLASARGDDLGTPSLPPGRYLVHSESAPVAAPAVAIVGLGCRLPNGGTVAEFWDNVVRGASAITEVPADRWDPSLYYDPDASAPDKTYTRIGGFLRDFHFDGRRFRIPPKVAEQIDPVQQITLESVADALHDAGLRVDRRGEGREFDRERCAVILGNSLGGEVKDRYAVRITWPEVEQKLRHTLLADDTPAERERRISEFEVTYKAGLPEVNEDSMPGELSNVIAGRIANAFDLGGANFTVDAACASSMAAVQAAVKGLQDGDFDLAITGGADRSMNVPTYVKFCKIGALSPDHSAPFDASANGFVMGEGCAILVLKRYEDAVADGDRVYAVIRGIGASSDGKGKGITAPNIQGQIRALHRAYEDAGLEPWQVDLVEAHGTSTVVGDKVEVEALNAVIGEGRRPADDPIRIGSVKSMIGHLKSAAGAASLLKAALALHHGVLPPSIGFRRAPDDVPLTTIPLAVQTRAEPWPTRASGLRRAGVSAFGFGGTNFHVVLESFAGQPLPASRPVGPPTPQPLPEVPAQVPAAPPAPSPLVAPVDAPELPEGIWATSGAEPADVIAGLQALRAGRPAPWEPSAPIRVAAAYADADERHAQLDRAISALQKGTHADMLRARGIHLQEGPVDGLLAVTFTGQGSQYADMGRDLAAVFPLVAETFAEADRILAPTLGRPITDYINLTPGEDAAEKEDVLRHTEFSQPATLAMDVAILRLLAAHGVAPDMVAGHSLGEYGAAVAAGIMTFEQALLAVSARGREMASIRLEDPGKMSGIATSTAAVEEVLAEVDGYVIPANKNCPTQTVIAGASDAVDEATERFRARGVTVYPLPVSHAFHSQIVAPATEPLMKVLRELGLKPPRRPITTNVTAEWYPTGEDAVPAIIDLLGQQISSPVEWTAQIERMYDSGARIFLECGPKRALTGFAVAILKRRPHLALYTNHPKRGGVLSFRDALAGLLAAGFSVRSTAAPDVPDLLFEPEARKATTAAVQAWMSSRTAPAGTEVHPDLAQGILSIVAKTTGYDLEELDLDYELEADLGIDTVKQAEVFSQVREQYSIPQDSEFSLAEHRTLRSLIDWAGDRVGATRPATPRREPAPVAAAPRGLAPRVGEEALQAFARAAAGVDGLDAEAFARAMMPAVQDLVQAAFDAARARQPAPPPPPPAPAEGVVRPPPQPSTADEVRIACTGASVGLPGGDEVFGSDNFARILVGENRISHIGDRATAFLDLSLVRLVKDAQTGSGGFLPVDDVSQVIRLAGVKGHFDIGDYGIPEGFARALDVTTCLAIAAGIEALRDAGIPLIRDYQVTQGGKKVPRGWVLPPALQDGTGVVFASAFPGYTQLVEKLAAGGDDGEGRFDRRFLFQILSMGHAQFAQLIRARGPNTQVNAACASSTQAVAVAEDWIRAGRCDRVIVIGADDVTNEALLKWIGGGFMAAGAATTEEEVEKAALPFDRRRHGMIIGMGAVGLVIERASDALARGVTPIAELIGCLIANSAFHGTRLDPPHIAAQMDKVVAAAAAREGKSPAALAASALFMSHETYTPARGGSAAAEIDALRSAFGTAASQITIANTKGFTGHAMGAGIEDAVALKALQYGRIPPVANFEEPDEDLGDLRISRGERRRVDYAIRLAAGFGSQLAIAIWRRVAQGDERVDPARRTAWLRQITGFDHVVETLGDRALHAEPAEADRLLPLPSSFPSDHAPPPEPEPVEAARPPGTTLEPAPTRVSAPRSGGVLGDLVALIAEKTGYGPDELEPEFELEADLGIDTVKQAEIFSVLRERYGLQSDDDFRLADYPTIEALAGYLERASLPTGPFATDEPVIRTLSPDIPTDFDLLPKGGAPSSAALADLLGVIAEKTGYGLEDLDPEFELEADLGIDTVKQAEIFSELRERYGLRANDSFRLADHPTIESLARWLDRQRGAAEPEDDELATTLVPDTQPSLFTPVPEERTHEPAETTWTPAPARRGDAPEGATWTSPELPPAFRIRRPVLTGVPRRGDQPVHGRRARVLGDGPLAEAVRAALAGAGVLLDGEPDLVVDAGVDVLESFRTARSLDGGRPSRWMAVTRLGGLRAQAPHARAFADGARAGLTKALGREWETTRVTVLDIAPEQPDAEAAATVLAELRADPLDEVFVRNRQRRGVAYRVEPMPAPAALERDRVVLITGGARGIGARVARAIAERGPVRLALVGRAPAPDAAVDLDAAKKAIRGRLKEQHERVTPAMVEAELAAVRKGNEIRATLDELAALGASVRYYEADLSDPASILPLLAAVTEDLGPPGVAVHGAGIEESRLVGDKDDDAFRRVFDGKARGGRALLEALPAETFFVSMGSVAGRFGNAGQVDYAAANDALARLCWVRPNALHVDWTAWDDVGMAVRGGMRSLLEQRGVDLLPADAGAGLLVDLVAEGITGEVVVAGRLGDFKPTVHHPLLDEVAFAGAGIIARRRVSLESDPWIADHRIEGTPVMPGVVGLELMTAAAAAASPGLPPVGARAVSFSKPVKLHRDEPVDLRIEANPVDPFEVRCTLISERVLKTGRVQQTRHFEATVVLGEVMPAENLPSAFFPDEPVDPDAIYGRFFHGPRFQVLERVIGIASDGLVASAHAPSDQIAPGLYTAPLALEAAFQAAGLHRMVTEGDMALPATLREVRVLRLPADEDRLELTVHFDGVSYDVDVDGPTGPALRVRGFRMIDLERLPPDKRFPTPDVSRPRSFPDRGATTPGAPPRAARPGPNYDDATARAVWGEEDVEAWLTATELRALRGRGTTQRQEDRVAGRVAAKRALTRLTGERPHAIRISTARSGEPVVYVGERPGPRVSISHRDGRAIAIAVSRGRVGIDLERVEDRSEAFSRDWFSRRELELAGGDAEKQTLLWSIKEAVLKALGVGMAISPREIEVRSLGQGGGDITLKGEAEHAWKRLGGGSWRVQWRREEGLFVVVTARLTT